MRLLHFFLYCPGLLSTPIYLDPRMPRQWSPENKINCCTWRASCGCLQKKKLSDWHDLTRLPLIVNPQVVGSIPSAGRHMCDGHLWFKLLKVGGCPWPAGSTPGHTSPMSPNEHWTRPDDGAARAKALGCQRGSCGSVRRGRGGDRYSPRRR